MGAELLLVRHGQSTWNAERRWAGHADPPLSPAGRRSARDLAERVADLGLTGAVSSDQRRALDTASIVARHCDLGGVEVDARLRERRCDAWSGRTSTEIELAYPGWLERWRRGESRELPDGSETWRAFSDRVGAGLREIATRSGRWLVVSHAGVFRVVDAALGAPGRKVANLEGRWLTGVGGRLVDRGVFEH